MQLPLHLQSQREKNRNFFLKKNTKKTVLIILIIFSILLFIPFSFFHSKTDNEKINISNQITNTNNETANASNETTEIENIDHQISVEPFNKNEINQQNDKEETINKDDLSPNTKYELYYPDNDDFYPSNESIAKCEQFSYSSNYLNNVPDSEQNVIEDPVAYVNQPPERPLIPRNFYQKIEGVHNLEISPGVIIPHNFSGIKTDKVIHFNKHLINVTTFDSGNVKEHFIYLPPFDWKVPHGLSQNQSDLFFKQPENHWHFNDCKMWNIDVIWEVKNGVSKLSDHSSKCKNHNYTNNLNFCEWPKSLPEDRKPQFKGDVFAFGGHYIEIFQHFLDNGISHIAAASFGLGFERIPNITLFTSGCGSTCTGIMNKFGFKDIKGGKNVNTQVSAENLILIPSMRVLHPYYFEYFRSKLDQSQPEMTIEQAIGKYESLFNVKNVTEDTVYQKNKIMILPRGHGSGGNARIIYNIDDLVNRLRTIHGEENVVVYRKSSGHHLNSIDDMRFFFGRAKAIIAPHGGACYNHFFSDTGIDFVEMIPMLDNGKYPKQTHWNKLIPFAHLAFLTSVQFHSQRFWRYITMNVDINYNIDVDDFINWSKQIPSIANPGSVGEVDIKNTRVTSPYD